MLVSENLRKLIGVAVMAAIVVVGVVATSGDDSDFSRTRNAAFAKGGVMAKEAPPAKGGDCCDETLYRLGQIEDRLSQIESSLQQALPMVRDAQLADDGPTAEELLVALENFAGQPLDRMYAAAVVGSVIFESRLLVGVPLQTAQQVVRSLGFGFAHESQDGRDLDPVRNWGTRRDGRGGMAAIGVHTRNGLVSEVRTYQATPNR